MIYYLYLPIKCLAHPNMHAIHYKHMQYKGSSANELTDMYIFNVLKTYISQPTEGKRKVTSVNKPNDSSMYASTSSTQ